MTETNENRVKRVKNTVRRVEPSLATPGYWRPSGSKIGPSSAAVVPLADFLWMMETIQARLDREAELDAATRSVLDSVHPTGDPMETLARIRELQAVYDRA